MIMHLSRFTELYLNLKIKQEGIGFTTEELTKQTEIGEGKKKKNKKIRGSIQESQY